MSMMPGNPCHKDADFPHGQTAIQCREENCSEETYVEETFIQGRCRECHEVWMENFINGEYDS